MPLILPTRNPLAYPCGVAPGFDSSHVAAAGISPGHGFSGVFFNGAGGFVNLLTGKPPTSLPANLVTSGINGYIGPSMVTNNVGRGSTFGGQSTANDTSFTLAAVVFPVSFPTNNVVFSTSMAANTGFWLGFNSTGLFSIWVTGTRFTSTQLTAGIPYFLAASGIANTTTGNTVVVNLATGQTILAARSFAGTASSASDGTYGVGQSGSLNAADAQYSHVMFAPVLSSGSQLQKWAADPLSFWYPRRQQYRIGAQSAAGFPWWAVRNNIPVIGTGGY